ncbi:hypothetical protein TcasGA2_TC008748 [Tribolium castaneum]|uniref:Uncharacterized protein n=1 Tax=Tribolium castaneum TaxID=7070 RepID=D6WS63_TRICA|nr:hypothetical protein TcasGA2_TC008748 [Tribolium castaneum]
MQTQFVAPNLDFMCAVSWKTITDALRRLEAAEAANVTFAATTFGSGKIEQKEDAQKEERHVDSDALFRIFEVSADSGRYQEIWAYNRMKAGRSPPRQPSPVLTERNTSAATYHALDFSDRYACGVQISKHIIRQCRARADCPLDGGQRSGRVMPSGARLCFICLVLVSYGTVRRITYTYNYPELANETTRLTWNKYAPKRRDTTMLENKTVNYKRSTYYDRAAKNSAGRMRLLTEIINWNQLHY